jgi:hypothetical protein
MLKALHTLVFCLAVLAVGVMQVFGVQAGYLCSCTGTVAEENSCHESHCACPEMAETQEHQEAEHGQPHQHQELREATMLSSAPTGIALPPVVTMDLPEIRSPRVPLATERSAFRRLEEAEPKPPDRHGESPPMAELVAKAIVRLI